jgi:hypothetical protein
LKSTSLCNNFRFLTCDSSYVFKSTIKPFSYVVEGKIKLGNLVNRIIIEKLFNVYTESYSMKKACAGK